MLHLKQRSKGSAILKNKMAACGVSNKHIAALVLVILALVLHVIGFSAPYWYFQKFAKTESYSGLWCVCVAISGGSTECSNGSNLPGKLIYNLIK